MIIDVHIHIIIIGQTLKEIIHSPDNFYLPSFIRKYLSEVICNYGQNLQRIYLRILMLSAFLTTILNEKLKVILLQLFLFGISVGKADGILQEFRSKSFRKLDGLS